MKQLIGILSILLLAIAACTPAPATPTETPEPTVYRLGVIVPMTGDGAG
jgi:hypothetical protein